jgi:hypothetical protein
MCALCVYVSIYVFVCMCVCICMYYIVTYRPIARQRLRKQIPAEANARNNRMSITRERISKHESLTIEAVLCVVSSKWL